MGARWVIVLLACLAPALWPADAAPAPQLGEPKLVGRLPAVIDESSGIIRGHRYPDKSVFWTHNDSGDSARIFAVDGSTLEALFRKLKKRSRQARLPAIGLLVRTGSLSRRCDCRVR